jgi:biopolymer transport protein ExbB
MMHFSELLAALQVGGWVVLPLVALAFTALVIVFDRFYVLARLAHIPSAWLEGDGIDIGIDGDAARAVLATLPARHALRGFATALLNATDAPLWWLEARAQDAAQQVQRQLNRGLWVLETIVTAAPLLGLLGTIIGMMRSFHLMGNAGLVNPAGVTGGVAQALIATAIGLLIALVALFGFNYFSRRVGQVLDDLEQAGTRLITQVRLAREGTPGAVGDPP